MKTTIVRPVPGRFQRLALLALVPLLALLASATVTAACLGEKPLRGVNLAGAEFNSKRLPGKLHHDYTYPSAGEFDYFAARGATVIRLPVRWERVQRELNSPLDDGEMAAIRKTLALAKARGLCLLLDIHNYGMYRGDIIGSDEVPASAFEDLWLRLAQSLEEPEHLALGLMNEPFKLDIASWGDIAKDTLSSLRNAGSEHLVMISGARWSGVHDWLRNFSGTSNGKTFSDVSDPLGRTVIEVHQYTNPHYSGTKEECLEPEHFNAMFEAVAEWARTHDQTLFLGEFGVAASDSCLATLDHMLTLASDTTVWKGWAYWAAGAWWGDYFMSVSPRNGNDAPQMAVLESHFQEGSCPGSAKCPGPPENVDVNGEATP